MIINYYGLACFKIQSNNLVLAFDPFSKETGLRPPRFKTDIVLITHNHYDHNNIEALEGDFFVVDGPGEYEVKGVPIQGIQSFHDNQKGKERGLNTIYRLEIEGITICHLGDLGQDSLTDEQLEKIAEVDILMIPVGGIYTINGQKAATIISQIEPRLVIPMHYQLPGLKIKLKPVDDFVKMMGLEKKETISRLVIKEKDLPSEGTKTIIMSLK